MADSKSAGNNASKLSVPPDCGMEGFDKVTGRASTVRIILCPENAAWGRSCAARPCHARIKSITREKAIQGAGPFFAVVTGADFGPPSMPVVTLLGVPVRGTRVTFVNGWRAKSLYDGPKRLRR